MAFVIDENIGFRCCRVDGWRSLNFVEQFDWPNFYVFGGAFEACARYKVGERHVCWRAGVQRIFGLLVVVVVFIVACRRRLFRLCIVDARCLRLKIVHVGRLELIEIERLLVCH